jgi:DNA repair protein RadA/Sms
MAKIKSKWICQSCGYETSGFLGKCPDCSSWGTLIEEIISSKEPTEGNLTFDRGLRSSPQLLKNISLKENIRYRTGMAEFDNVLGGGIVKGSMVLVGGDPGIGKSTITLQSCGNFAKQGLKTFYISAEESEKQIKLRAERLNIDSENLYILAETNIELIKENINNYLPEIVIIDSIQAVYSSNITSSSGSISQVRECCSTLMNLAKTKALPIILISHVTKDGVIAGPKVLEHMVDTVLYFEGDRYKSYRILRTIKNRFGSTNEIGIFNMEDAGLVEVTNPSKLFLAERGDSSAPGSVVIASNEGKRPILIEIQALVGPTTYPSPRRVATGIEYNRVLQILAVLERRVGISLNKHDVYVNVVGGIDIHEPSADLGVALAVATCFRNIHVDAATVIIGEVGLSGEIRRVTNIESRINEAAKTGFKRVILPSANLPLKNKADNLDITGVSRLIEAITRSISPKENFK